MPTYLFLSGEKSKPQPLVAICCTTLSLFPPLANRDHPLPFSVVLWERGGGWLILISGLSSNCFKQIIFYPNTSNPYTSPYHWFRIYNVSISLWEEARNFWEKLFLPWDLVILFSSTSWYKDMRSETAAAIVTTVWESWFDWRHHLKHKNKAKSK